MGRTDYRTASSGTSNSGLAAAIGDGSEETILDTEEGQFEELIGERGHDHGREEGDQHE